MMWREIFFVSCGSIRSAILSFQINRVLRLCLAAGILLTCTVSGSQASSPLVAESVGVVLEEFIFEQAPFAQCHASTIAETSTGLVVAWFGGTREKNPDVGIWVSRQMATGWTAPVEVADGVQHSAKRYPCWNPVLYQSPAGPLMLFYKVGPSPDTWWGMLMTSDDGGVSWSQGRRLPEDIVGPVKNKPVLLSNGVLLCPSSTEHEGWRVHFDSTDDLGQSWQHSDALNDGTQYGAIQPSVLIHSDQRLQILCRSKQGRILESWSSDGGTTWSPLAETILPNPNSGTDAVTLADGRHLLVYNHTTTEPGKWGGPRSPLNVAVSGDGVVWQAAAILEDAPGEFSYPAVIQSADGLVHITYTWKRRRVKHVVLDMTHLKLQPMPDGQWPE